MTDDPILAAENDLIRPRLTGVEQDVAGRDVRTAIAHARIDSQEVRLNLIERRLDLRDPPRHPKTEGGPQ